MGKSFEIFADVVQFFVKKIYHRVKYTGLENIEKDKNYLVVANHVSATDVVVLYDVIPNMRFMAKEELFKKPIIGSVIKKGGGFKISRGTHDFSSLLNAIKMLKTNSVLIFPEGTRHALEKQVKAKVGAAYIANVAKVEILPIYLSVKRHPFSKINVIIGQASKIALERIPKEKLEEVSQEIMEDVYKLGEDIDG